MSLSSAVVGMLDSGVAIRSFYARRSGFHDCRSVVAPVRIGSLPLAAVAQLVRASDCIRMSGFESPLPPLKTSAILRTLYAALHGCTSGEVARLVEHRIENAGVGGSSPPLATKIAVPLKRGGDLRFGRAGPVSGRVPTRAG